LYGGLCPWWASRFLCHDGASQQHLARNIINAPLQWLTVTFGRNCPDMRLLNTGSGLMREYISDDDIPEYAILSHTWESNQEISFLEWEDREALRVRRKKGYEKIQRFITQAHHDGFAWVWIDTYAAPPLNNG
jgi:hypothetical protein